jgi:hypothetical protein
LNWIVSNLQHALNTWNGKLDEILVLVTQSPADFRGGGIWTVMLDIHDTLRAIGLSLLVLFFLIGVMKTFGSMSEIKRPEVAVKVFIRFAIAEMVVVHGIELMLAVLRIVHGVVRTVLEAANFTAVNEMLLPDTLITAIEETSFIESIPLWAVTLLGSLFITVLSFIMIMSVYGRFFKLFLYAAIAPIFLATFAGEPTQNIGTSFVRSYAAVCLEGAVVVLACIIFSQFATTAPVLDEAAPAVTQVWTYVGELLFNMLVLVGTVKMADRVIREMTGL